MATIEPAVSPRGQADDACLNSGLGLRSLDRWETLSLVTELRQPLGLTDRDVMVLRAHLTVLPHGLLKPSGLNVSFMSVSEILKRACGMDERRFRRGEARLEKVGLIRRNLSANGRRFPERDRDGKIVQAYGIDLSPIFEMYDRLVLLRDRIAAERANLRQRKNALSARLQVTVRRLTSAGHLLPDWAEALRVTVRNALRRTGASLEDIDALEVEIDRITEVAAASEVPETDSAASENYPPALPDMVHETAVSPVRNTGDDGQCVRHIESKHKDIKKEGSAFDPRRIHETWLKTETLREFYLDTPLNEHDLAAVLIQFSSFIGLGRTSILKALAILGWENGILVLDYIAARTSNIGKPEGYLASMLRSYEVGQPIAAGRVRPPVFSKSRPPV